MHRILRLPKDRLFTNVAGPAKIFRLQRMQHHRVHPFDCGALARVILAANSRREPAHGDYGERAQAAKRTKHVQHGCELLKSSRPTQRRKSALPEVCHLHAVRVRDGYAFWSGTEIFSSGSSAGPEITSPFGLNREP